MLRMKWVGAVGLAAVLATTIAAPASAGEFPILGCDNPGGSELGVHIYDEYDDTGHSTFTGPLDVEVKIGDVVVDGDWVGNPVSATSGAFSVWLEDVFWHDWDTTGIFVETAHVTITDGTHTSSCDVTYYPAAADVSGKTNVNAGDTVSLLVDPDVPGYNYVALSAQLEVWTGSTWKSVAESPVTRFGGYALLSYKPKQSQNVRVSIINNDTWGGKPSYLGSSYSFWLGVNYATPTYLAKSSSVVQSKYATATVAYGDMSSAGDATLQRYASGVWQTVSSKQLDSGLVTFTWTPAATYKYRVVLRPYSSLPNKVTSSFSVTFLRAVDLTAPTSAPKGTVATLTVKHRLATSGKGTVQYWSGSAWKGYKTFTLSSSGTTKVGVTVSSTRMWRVVVGAYASQSRTIAAH